MRHSERRLLHSAWPVALLACSTATEVFALTPSLNVADPSRFRVTTFTSGLAFPTSMQSLSDGSILIATNPTSAGFYSASGQLRRFVDTNSDGVADSPSGQLLYSGLPGSVTSVRQSNGLFFVTTLNGANAAISILKAGATPGASLTSVGRIDLGFDAGTVHQSYALATRQTPGQTGSTDVFFNIGSKANNANSTNAASISYTNLSGLSNGTVATDSIYKFTATQTSGSVSLSNLTQVAVGLRNAAGIAVQPASGDLYFEDNGMDGLIDANEPLSADELNKISAADIGGTVEDFGFADDYIAYRTGTRVGSGAIQPTIAFTPLPKPNGAENEGANEIAFAPSEFPTGLNNGVFVGFHGKFNTGGTSNEENPLAYYSFDTGEYFHFILGKQAGIGHFDGLLATDNSLFVSDLTQNGKILSGTGFDGAVYQIFTVPEPASIGFAGLAFALVGRRSRRKPVR